MLDHLNTFELVGTTLLLMAAFTGAVSYVHYLAGKFHERKRIKAVLRDIRFDRERADYVRAQMSEMVAETTRNVQAQEANTTRHGTPRGVVPAAQDVTAQEHAGTTRLTLARRIH